MPLALALLALGTAASAAAAPGTVSFKFASQTLTVPEGFTVELVAAPPMVNRPISVAFDEEGRLYATDSSGLSERADIQFAQKPHRIVRLTDRDGAGRFDESVVFAENMMFPQGAMFHEGSLYVGAPPHIWKLTDTDGDGVSDRREVWYDGKTLTGCANDLHGPYLGPEGWFYWTKGASAEQRHTLGNGKPLVTRAAHIFARGPMAAGSNRCSPAAWTIPWASRSPPPASASSAGHFFRSARPANATGSSTRFTAAFTAKKISARRVTRAPATSCRS